MEQEKSSSTIHTVAVHNIAWAGLVSFELLEQTNKHNGLFFLSYLEPTQQLIVQFKWRNLTQIMEPSYLYEEQIMEPSYLYEEQWKPMNHFHPRQKRIATEIAQSHRSQIVDTHFLFGVVSSSH